MPRVPGYKRIDMDAFIKHKAEFSFSKTDKDLNLRLHELNKQIKHLRIEQREVVKAIKHRKTLRNAHALRPVHLYALRLEDECWYIGMSFNPKKRFKTHLNGGKHAAQWTKLHKPLEIYEVRETEFYNQDEVAQLENDMTIEYAMMYGSSNVRGGGYCQHKPIWPDIIIQNELIS